MTFGEEAQVSAGTSSVFCSGTETGSSDISGLSEEQLDLLLIAFESNPNPRAERTSELAEKLELTTGQVQLWFRKQTLEMDALAREADLMVQQGIVPPELQRRIRQDEELGLLQDKLKALDQEKVQRTRSLHIPGLSKEQLDLLLETFKSYYNPTAEQTSDLAQKLKLTPRQVQLWFRKERLDQRKKLEASFLEIGCLLLGIVTPELRRRTQQDGEIRRKPDKLKVQVQENEEGKIKLMQDRCKVLALELQKERLIADGKIKLAQLENEIVTTKGKIKLQQDRVKVLEQENEQLAGHACSERENMVGAVQLGPPPTPSPSCDTGTPSDRMRKRASENSFEQGKKSARTE